MRGTTLTSAFDSASALSSCNKGAIYRLWGATLRMAYPTWSGESSACLIDGNVGTAATAWLTSPSTATTTHGPIADWDVSAVSNMYQLFYNRPTFNADIGAWNVASVSDMSDMFNAATAFNGNIGAWCHHTHSRARTPRPPIYFPPLLPSLLSPTYTPPFNSKLPLSCTFVPRLSGWLRLFSSLLTIPVASDDSDLGTGGFFPRCAVE
jgi:hypothetical protein